MTSAFKWIYEQWKRIFGICFLKGSSGLSNQIIRDEFKKLWRRAKKRIEQEYGSHLYQYASGFFNRTIFVTAETRYHQRWNSGRIFVLWNFRKIWGKQKNWTLNVGLLYDVTFIILRWRHDDVIASHLSSDCPWTCGLIQLWIFLLCIFDCARMHARISTPM